MRSLLFQFINVIFQDGNLLESDSNTINITNSGRTLHFPFAVPENTGEYVCYLENRIGTAALIAFVEIHGNFIEIIKIMLNFSLMIFNKLAEQLVARHNKFETDIFENAIKFIAKSINQCGKCIYFKYSPQRLTLKQIFIDVYV